MSLISDATKQIQCEMLMNDSLSCESELLIHFAENRNNPHRDIGDVESIYGPIHSV